MWKVPLLKVALPPIGWASCPSVWIVPVYFALVPVALKPATALPLQRNPLPNQPHGYGLVIVPLIVVVVMVPVVVVVVETIVNGIPKVSFNVFRLPDSPALAFVSVNEPEMGL
jgi:hypothetical protein